MATTYTLKFIRFKTLDSYDGMTDVIRTVHWKMEAETDDPTPVTAEAFGTAVLPHPTLGSFIAYGSVDVPTMQGWFNSLKDDNGELLIDSTKRLLDDNIERQVNPSITEQTPSQSFQDGVAV